MDDRGGAPRRLGPGRLLVIIPQLESAVFDREQAESLVESFDANLDQLATTNIYRAMLVQTFALAEMLFAAFRLFG